MSNEDKGTTDEDKRTSDLIIPTLDLAEVFVRNQTTLNRQNILAVDKDRFIYNAYIGTSHDLPDKSVLHIGTSNVNPNIGEITLMSHEDKSYFNKMNQIDIDFDSIHLNGNVITNGSEWTPFYDESGSGKTAWHMTTRVGAIVEGIMNVPLMPIPGEQVYLMSDDLFFKQKELIAPEITLPNNDKIKSNTSYIYYLNLNKFFTEVAKVEGATRFFRDDSIEGGYIPDKTKFIGENIQIKMDIDHLSFSTPNKCYYLKLQTDLEESSFEPESTYKYVLTNPIEFAYTFDNAGKMLVTVREIVTNQSIPYIYANEII